MVDMNIEKEFGIKNFDLQIKNPQIEDNLKEYIPAKDDNYYFDEIVTKAILASFANNKKTLLFGLHGVGKSTHIEQVSARLNWPCVRVNLDGHIGRIDLIGRDVITLKEGKQITEFKNGILPWAMENGIALILDEYDAGRPEIMFVLQRVLESEGRLTLSEINKVITPHKNFRIFATANTIGFGDEAGIYHGTNMINQGQLDRFNIIVEQKYMNPETELKVLYSKLPEIKKKYATEAKNMTKLAELTRIAFKNGDLSVLISPRTIVSWAENLLMFNDFDLSLKFAYLNKCDENDKEVFAELFQRCFAKELKY